MRRPWRVEYSRPDGWWHIASYATEEAAHQQLNAQQSSYPGVTGKFRVTHADDKRPGLYRYNERRAWIGKQDEIEEIVA